MKRAEMNRQENLDRQITFRESDLNSARADHASAAVKLAENSLDQQALEELRVLDNEITEHERQLSWLKIAKTEAARLDTIEYKRYALEQLKKRYENLQARMERQKKLAAQVVEIAASFGPLLAEYESIAQDNHADAFAIVKACADGNVAKFVEAHFPALSSLVRGNAAAVPLVDALWVSGLGRTGLRLDPWIQIGGCGATGSLQDFLMQADNALGKLAELIEKRAKECAQGA